MNDVNFQNFGYPKPGDNARGKSGVYYDTIEITTGVTEYPLFVGSPSGLTRNKQFPFANDEVFFIDTISGYFTNMPLRYSTAQHYSQMLARTFLQVMVNDKEYLKIPGYLFMSFFVADTIGDNTQDFPARLNRAFFRLPIPITINASANVSIKIVTTAQAATTFNTGTIRLQLSGLKVDKLTSYQFDNRAELGLEKLSYVCYDTYAALAAAGVQPLFLNAAKAPTDYSKYFPLSVSEAFEVGAIQVFSPGYSGEYPFPHYAERVTQQLKINVNGVDLLTIAAAEMHYILSTYAASFTDPTPVSTNYSRALVTKSIYVLPEPVIIPTNAQVAATIEQGALTGTASQYSSVSLIGTLTRKVQ